MFILHFKHFLQKCQKIFSVLENGLIDGVVLNVNFPNLNSTDIKGVKICRQAKANWVEEFDKRTSPQGREYYWLGGKFVNYDQGEDNDEWALENGYVSITPTKPNADPTPPW